MKLPIIISLSAFLMLSLFSCEASKKNASTTDSTETMEDDPNKMEKIWTDGILTISGVIHSVVQEKDGQTIVLHNNKGIEYKAIVSIPNLGKNSAQYREFKVGESVGFRGNPIDNQTIVVREVLETK